MASSPPAGRPSITYTPDLRFISRRSPVLCRHGAVSTSQPLATNIGLDILKAGGNALDACVAMAAALNVTEPTSTGLGGDCFAIFYDAERRTVEGLNGSGRAPAALHPAAVPPEHRVGDSLRPHSVHSVTVPGAAAGWMDALQRWGSGMSLAAVLAPAIALAEEGFPVSPITADSWRGQESLLRRHEGGHQLLISGRAPAAGEIFRNPNLARTLRLLAERGKDGFYSGEVAEATIALLQSQGGLHAQSDLSSHRSSFPAPLSVRYRGVDIHELPPSGQGITALIALNILSQLQPPLSHYAVHSADHLHLLIEAMRLAFADTRWYVADSEHSAPTDWLLSAEYAKQRAALIDPKKATVNQQRGAPVVGSDTVSFCAVDGQGNACSFINSNYMGFGSGFVPAGCGFSLQNRGAGFSLQADHPNVLKGGKRPYHTIIPGMAVHADGRLLGPFSVMGGFMQPQGHVQVLSGMLDFALDPQSALDLGRFCIEKGEAGGHVCIEDGVGGGDSEAVVEELRRRGHEVRVVSSWERAVFGRGQIIRKDDNGVLWCGSDGRGDGCSQGY